MQKIARFCIFLRYSPKKIQVAADRTTLMPACLPIAHLKPYGPHFSWKISKMARLLKLGVPALGVERNQNTKVPAISRTCWTSSGVYILLLFNWSFLAEILSLIWSFMILFFASIHLRNSCISEIDVQKTGSQYRRYQNLLSTWINEIRESETTKQEFKNLIWIIDITSCFLKQ